MREVNMLKKRDKAQNKICFVDIASKDYDPARNENISYEAVITLLNCTIAAALTVTLCPDARGSSEIVLLQYMKAMGSIHGILPGGKVITNVDVFRKLYEVVGLGWVYAITKFGPINQLANRYDATVFTV